jgi:hypothetical protein
LISNKFDYLTKSHNIFEQQAISWLMSQGWIIEDLTYHNNMAQQVCQILKERASPTALIVRTRADRIAIHREQPVEFKLEIKTHISQRHQDIVIEAFPLGLHLIESRFGALCLYAHRDITTNKECGFWVHQLPQLREIRIPSRWDDETALWFRSVFESIFPDVPVIDTPSRGSGDPFAIIDASVVRTLPHWKKLVIDLTARFSLS